MSLSTPHLRLVFILSIFLCISIVIGGCSVLGVSGDPDSQYTSQGQALESGDGEGDAPLDNPGDVSSFALACPSDMEEFVLFLSHTWDFSPNRDLELM